MSLPSRLANLLLPRALRNRMRSTMVATIPAMQHLELRVRLPRIKAMGFTPTVILDIGACRGEFSRFVHTVWPAARIVGFEPNESERVHLESLKQDVPQFDYVRCFLGPEAREVRYTPRGAQTSLFDTPTGKAVAPMYVLDELIAQGKVPTPQFMKLDVQGFELDVLRGGTRAMEQCELIQLEVSFQRLAPGMPIVHDVVDFMRSHGFEWFDVGGILRRRSDDALLQLDVLFIRKDHPIRREGIEA